MVEDKAGRRLYLWIKDRHVRDQLRNALSELTEYDLVTTTQLPVLKSGPQHRRSVIIICREIFSTVVRETPADFHLLFRHAHIILALKSTELLESSHLVTVADSVLFIDAPLDRIKQIVKMSEHGYFLPPKRMKPLPEMVLEEKRFPQLSKEEGMVLLRVSQGLGNRTIADILGVSENHVKGIVSALLAKVGVRNRTELAVVAMRNRRPPTEDRSVGY